VGWDGMGWMDLCMGLFYEHRFAMLIIGIENLKNAPQRRMKVFSLSYEY